MWWGSAHTLEISDVGLACQTEIWHRFRDNPAAAGDECFLALCSEPVDSHSDTRPMPAVKPQRRQADGNFFAAGFESARQLQGRPHVFKGLIHRFPCRRVPGPSCRSTAPELRLDHVAGMHQVVRQGEVRFAKLGQSPSGWNAGYGAGACHYGVKIVFFTAAAQPGRRGKKWMIQFIIRSTWDRPAIDSFMRCLASGASSKCQISRSSF